MRAHENYFNKAADFVMYKIPTKSSEPLKAISFFYSVLNFTRGM